MSVPPESVGTEAHFFESFSHAYENTVLPRETKDVRPYDAIEKAAMKLLTPVLGRPFHRYRDMLAVLHL